MKIIEQKMIEIAEKEVIQEKEVGENNKEYFVDHHLTKKEVLQIIYKMKIWYKILLRNLLEIFSKRFII